MKPDIVPANKTWSLDSRSENQNATLEPRSFATKITKPPSTTTTRRHSKFGGKAVRRPSTSILRPSPSGEESAGSESEMQVDMPSEASPRTEVGAIDSEPAESDTLMRSDQDDRTDTIVPDTTTNAQSPARIQRRPTWPKPIKYPNADIPLPLPRHPNPERFPLPAHVVRSIEASGTRTPSTIELVDLLTPSPRARHPSLSAGYTSFVAALHGRHPELSFAVSKEAAYALGCRTASLPMWGMGSQSTRSTQSEQSRQSGPGERNRQSKQEGFTFDAPMDDKKDPAYLTLMRDSIYMPHTGLYKTSPPLSFPMVTRVRSDGSGDGGERCANGQGRSRIGGDSEGGKSQSEGKSEGEGSGMIKAPGGKKEKEKGKKKKAFQDKEYLNRQVLVPLEGGDAIVFPDKLIEEMAFIHQGVGDVGDETSLKTPTVGTASPLHTDADDSSISDGRRVPKLECRIRPFDLNTDLDRPSSMSTHSRDADADTITFYLTHTPHLRAGQRLWNILQEQTCPAHLPPSLPSPFSPSSSSPSPSSPFPSPSDLAGLLAPLGPHPSCPSCRTRLSTLAQFHAHVNAIALLHCGREGHEDGKEVREDCRLCAREVKVAKAVRERMESNKGRDGRNGREGLEKELREAKERYVKEWPGVWEVPRSVWGQMRERGVWVASARAGGSDSVTADRQQDVSAGEEEE